ncbi:hypothetical protein AXK11_01190 [Cephaloticoccus primus]|uniref:Uncharacterized protein n=1 Tax=Cephaloticoccus primus TaxID=1548207 RepID=A0A139SU33_9BACT|nr:hypothetical protein AXK11_01190 [Cephaloticoccus primus]
MKGRQRHELEFPTELWVLDFPDAQHPVGHSRADDEPIKMLAVPRPVERHINGYTPGPGNPCSDGSERFGIAFVSEDRGVALIKNLSIVLENQDADHVLSHLREIEQVAVGPPIAIAVFHQWAHEAKVVVPSLNLRHVDSRCLHNICPIGE